MEDNQIRIQGQLNDIELRDRELMENWRELMSRTDPNALQGRTAGERWQLVKLVARIGRELRQKNVIDGSWSSEEENQLVNTCNFFFFWIFNLLFLISESSGLSLPPALFRVEIHDT